MDSDDPPDDLTFAPVATDRWPDFEALFRQGKRDEGGFPAGCWCIEWRLPRDEWEAGSGERNRLAMKHLVDSGSVPGTSLTSVASPSDGAPSRFGRRSTCADAA